MRGFRKCSLCRYLPVISTVAIVVCLAFATFVYHVNLRLFSGIIFVSVFCKAESDDDYDNTMLCYEYLRFMYSLCTVFLNI